jgi:hypothetical protein
MSFDLKLENGDLKIGPDGDLVIVENTEKLVQDILKMVMTELGANVRFPWYGCPITQSLVGTAYSKDFLTDIASQQLNNSLTTLQRMQQDQFKKNQIITPSEQIAAVQRATVERSPVDPRFFSIYVTVLSKAFRRVDVPTLQISL